ncbi:ABC transporter permease [Chloroflexota bacterium]
MKKVLAILRHEFHHTIRQKFYIIMVIGPLLLGTLGYGIYQGVHHWYEADEPEVLKVGYVDEAGILISDYTSPADIEFISYPSDAEAKSSILADNIDEYFVVLEDYVYTGAIIRFTYEGDNILSGDTRAAIEGFLLSSLLEGDVSDDVMERVKSPMLLASYEIDDDGEIKPESDELNEIIVPTIFAILFMISIFTSSGFMLQSVSEEKENRVMEILLSSVSSRQLFAGKVLGLGAAGLLQIVIWLITIKVFSEVASVNISVLEDLNVSFGVVFLGLLYFMMGYLLFAILMAGIGSMGSTAKESQGLSMMITMPGGLLPFYTFMFMQETEGVIFTVLTIFPLTAPVMGMIRVSAHTIASWEIALSLVVLAGSIVLAMWIAAKVFRTYLLMYGKRPALREIIGYIRKA